MNKQQLYDACEGKISKLAIIQYSGDWVIAGKYGMIDWMGDYWDIWVTGVHRDVILRTEVVNLIVSRLKMHCTAFDLAYNNEAVARCMDEKSGALLAGIIGARKKKQISPEHLAKLHKKSRQ